MIVVAGIVIKQMSSSTDILSYWESLIDFNCEVSLVPGTVRNPSCFVIQTFALTFQFLHYPVRTKIHKGLQLIDTTLLKPETCKQIDTKLESAGWVIQDKNRLNLFELSGVAVRETYADTGPTDYMLFNEIIAQS